MNTIRSNTVEKEVNHAERNADAWLETIREMVASAKGHSEADEFDDAVYAVERITESALSIEVRSPWHTPGDSKPTWGNAEYCLLLSTGGPALRLIGELSEHAEPSTARLEYQDWGTPWTKYRVTSEDEATLVSFASHFYFGE